MKVAQPSASHTGNIHHVDAIEATSCEKYAKNAPVSITHGVTTLHHVN